MDRASYRAYGGTKTANSVSLPRKSADRIGAMSESPDNPYLRDAVLTATPEQLQLMMYDGCIRFLLQARDAIEAKDYETSYEKLSRSGKIILEMRNGLNYEVNRELCERVASIYGFLHDKIMHANLNRDVDAIDDALRVLRIERETWQILVDKVNRVRESEESSGAPTAHEEEAAASFSVEG